MSLKADKVKAGYVDLTETEKVEIRNFIMQYDLSGLNEQRNLSDRILTATNKSLGPKSENSCPCCGR